ncbi:hypothetical protein FACS189434_13360 [Bacteroidia bacterium]|nr:hypothetical protein FACS189434_13360 [Bacteroidia bacterium]
MKKKIKDKSNTPTYIKIVGKIENHIKDNSVMVDYSLWYVGITNNPKIREKQHNLTYKNKMYLHICYAYSKEIGNQIEKYFSDKGTINKPIIGGAKKNSFYVYVFKAQASLLDKFVKFLNE